MIKITHHKSKYLIQLILNNKQVIMKFDTGSQITAISYRSLFPDVPKQKARVICDKLLKCTTKSFLLANGNCINGVLFKTNNIVLGGTKLPSFYFYLIPDINNKIELLGDDFIAGCNFSHTIKGDIIINAVDEKYQESIISEANMKFYELNSLEYGSNMF